MKDWKLHVPSEENRIQEYKCGLSAGQRVALRKDLLIQDHRGKTIGIHPKGEVWLVLAGIRSDPVLWLRQADGERHTWDDDVISVREWFEVVEGDPATTHLA